MYKKIMNYRIEQFFSRENFSAFGLSENSTYYGR